MITQHTYNELVAVIHRVRCNVKSLAAEARIIREETSRCGQAYKDLLAVHRRGRLREESRYAQLVLAYFRKRPYRQVETFTKSPVDAKRLIDKAKRYLWRVEEQDIRNWLKAA